MTQDRIMLSPRLQAVASLIPPTELLVDVGSDHGKLGAYCLRERICNRLIATDIHAAPAERTGQFLRLCGLEECSEVVCTDGLSGISVPDRSTIVIAGMGGLEIRKILQNFFEVSPAARVSLVLQPQRSFYELREFLSQKGIPIEEEKIACERDRYYVVIRTKEPDKAYTLSKEELYLGPALLRRKPELFPEYMAHQFQLMKKQALGNPDCAEILNKWEELL